MRQYKDEMITRRELLQGAAAGAAALGLPSLSFPAAKMNKTRVIRKAEDRFDLVLPSRDRVRILQLTDTHFGTPSDENKLKDEATKKLIRQLVDDHQPDLIFHTGDFINNDRDGVLHSAFDFMNDLGTPWSMVFGNHDHSTGNAGGISLDDYYARLENHATGFHNRSTGGRDYCYRLDLRTENAKPFASLFAFNCGGPKTGMIINETQSEWLMKQLERDKSAGVTTPILVMQHIPTVEYKTLFDEKAATGRQGEAVCFEQDKGAIFGTYQASGRVKAVFCGHDHVNDYFGDHKGVRLVYGRCTGYSGYGDWQRGARIIDLTQGERAQKTRVVLGKGCTETPEWSSTLAEG